MADQDPQLQRCLHPEDSEAQRGGPSLGRYHGRLPHRVRWHIGSHSTREVRDDNGGSVHGEVHGRGGKVALAAAWRELQSGAIGSLGDHQGGEPLERQDVREVHPHQVGQRGGSGHGTKVSFTIPNCQLLGGELAMNLELWKIGKVVAQHIPGKLNDLADWLSRCDVKKEKRPQELLEVNIIIKGKLTARDFFIPPPGATNSEANWKDVPHHSVAVFHNL